MHVLGAVRRPGLVRLPSGARVQDAIEAAGGLKRSANPDDLNLAQPLADGQQILIGTDRHPDGEVREAGGADAEPGGAPSRIDLNRATPGQLEELPGVGPVIAASITGPAGIRVGSPKKVTGTPLLVRSRSASRQTRPPADSRSRSVRNAEVDPPVSGTISKPNDSR